MNRVNALARLAVWSAFLVVALRLLHGSTMGTLSIPLDSLAALEAWADRTSPAVMALGLVRLGALAATWYLVAVTVLTVVADLAGWRRLAVVAAAASPALVRRVATRGAGAGLAAGALLGVTPLPTPLDNHPAGLPPVDIALISTGGTATGGGAAPERPGTTADTGVAGQGPDAARSAGRPRSSRATAPAGSVPLRRAALGPSGGVANAVAPVAGGLTGRPPWTAAQPPATESPAAPTTTSPGGPMPPVGTTAVPGGAAPVAGDAAPPAGSGDRTATMRLLPRVDAGTPPATPSDAPGPSPDDTGTGGTGSGTAARPGVPAGPTEPPDQTDTTPSDGETPNDDAHDVPDRRPRAPDGIAEGGATATMTRLPAPAPPAATGAGESTTAAPASAPATVPVAARAAAEGDDWVVELGDSFWSIAEETLAEAAAGARPGEAAVTRYWRRLVDTNRDRLADPANPDLLLPGQSLLVPPP